MFKVSADAGVLYVDRGQKGSVNSAGILIHFYLGIQSLPFRRNYQQSGKGRMKLMVEKGMRILTFNG